MSSYIRAAFSVAGDQDFDEGLRRVAELLREEMLNNQK
jgi:DNA-binding transcriptional MocR family regulator